MRRFLISVLALFGLTFAGAAQAAQPASQPLVDAAWLGENLGKDGLVVVDIRPEGYAAGHVPGAVSAPYGKFGWRQTVDGVVGQLPPVPEIEARIAGLGIGNDSRVVIVPAGVNSTDFGAATRVYWTFKVLGHDAVSILDGGWRAWSAADGAVSTETAEAKTAAFKAEFRPELVADAEDVAAASAQGTALIDARPKAQYLGQSKSPVVQTAGTIPGAVNIEQSAFYDEKAGAFAARERIAELVKAAGVEEDSEEITFCNTGHWASVAWFGLSEVLGRKDTRMYDGSMADWTRDETHPVVAKAGK